MREPATRVNSEYFLGLEIGGTKLQLFLADISGAIRDRIQILADRRGGAEGIRKQLQAAIADVCLRARVKAVGVGFGGPVDWGDGKVAVSHQVEGWSGFQLKKWLEAITRAEVVVDNDANVAAYGEARRGAGSGHGRVFYVTLGSGVGGGFVMKDGIYHGAHPGECEIGHLRLDRRGTTVESRCSGWAVDARIRDLPAIERTGPLWAATSKMDRAQARGLAPAVAAGDPAAVRILNEVAEDLAFGLSHVTHLLHPDVIVLGGGLALVGEPLRAAVAAALPGMIMEVFRPGPMVALTSLREDAVPVGALELARSVAVDKG